MPLTRRLWKRAWVSGLAVLSLVAVVLIIRQAGADDAAASSATVPTSTVTVSRRDLVRTEQVSGDLGYAGRRELSAHRAGVVTFLAGSASTVKPGRTLYAIDLEPTVLLTGTVPAYRPLSTASENGDDVRQLERALVKLGHGDDLAVDRNFTSATADAVRDWEKDLGRDDPDGTVELADVVFAQGPVRVADLPVSVGTQVQAVTSVLTVSSKVKVAEVDLEVGRSDQVGAKDVVTVSLPNGKDTRGRVASVGSDPQTNAADPSAEPTVPMVVTLTEPGAAADFDSGSVEVTIEQSRDDGVLAVPVTALLALAEGGFAVEVVDPDAPAGYRLLGVRTGAITDEYAGISGDGVREGLTVVVPG
jgi:peptidoglycan hydrolase-like protein with peptidoglycan-binding domain